MKRLLTIILLTSAICSCRTIQVVPEIHTEYVHDTIREQRVDSVWQDRWHTEYVKGDTVYVKDSTSRVQVKTDDKVKVVEVAVHDSIPYPVEVVREVKVVPPFYKWCAGIVILGLIGLVIWIAVKLRNNIYLPKLE